MEEHDYAIQKATEQGGLDALNAVLSQLSGQIDTLQEILDPVLKQQPTEADVPRLLTESTNKLRSLGERTEDISRRLSRIIDRIDL